MRERQRAAILLCLKRQRMEHPSHLPGDVEIAEALGIAAEPFDLLEVWRSLEIMESQGWVKLHKSGGPKYSVEITQGGLELAEQL